MNPRSSSAPKSNASLRVQLKEATSRAILDATEAALAEEGAGASLVTIAARAGIAVGTIYNYFADRDELMRALFDARREELLTSIDAATKAAAREPFKAHLEAFVRALLAHFDARRTFLRVALDDDARPTGAAPRSRTMQPLVERAARLARAGVREKVLRADAADLYPGILMGIVRGVLLTKLDDPRPLADEAPRVVDLFLRGAGVKR